MVEAVPPCAGAGESAHAVWIFQHGDVVVSVTMDQGIWAGNASHLVNGFFLAGLVVMIVRVRGRRIVDAAPHSPEDRRGSLADWLAVVLAGRL